MTMTGDQQDHVPVASAQSAPPSEGDGGFGTGYADPTVIRRLIQSRIAQRNYRKKLRKRLEKQAARERGRLGGQENEQVAASLPSSSAELGRLPESHTAKDVTLLSDDAPHKPPEADLGPRISGYNVFRPEVRLSSCIARIPDETIEQHRGKADIASSHHLDIVKEDKSLLHTSGCSYHEIVERILYVNSKLVKQRALIAAARAGHEVFMNLLIVIGHAETDPVFSNALESPILAAIGGHNIETVKLLLYQPLFNAAKRVNGETYYSIARNARGPNWIQEVRILEDAYHWKAGTSDSAINSRYAEGRAAFSARQQTFLESLAELIEDHPERALAQRQLDLHLERAKYATDWAQVMQDQRLNAPPRVVASQKTSTLRTADGREEDSLPNS